MKQKEKKDFSFVPVPYIGYNRTLGFQFGAVPMAMYRINKKDTISSLSISAGVLFYTTNKSWGIFQFNKIYFDENKYRAITALGGGNFNAQYYIDLPEFEGFLDFSTAAFFFKIELQRRIAANFYGGLNYTLVKLNTKQNSLAGIQTINSIINNLGGILTFDNRKNFYYPEDSYLATLKIATAPKFMGNDSTSSRLELEVNKYIKINNSDVVALRIHGAAGLGELVFNQQFVIGNKDMRGYTKGRFRGNQTVCLQGEYRWNPFKKIGFVGVAGVASAFNGDNESDNNQLLPAIGCGVRFTAFPKTT